MKSEVGSAPFDKTLVAGKVSVSPDKTKLNIMEFSDVHLGHKKTPTLHTLKLLRAAIKAGPELRRLDMIIIAGDLFDQALHWTDLDVTMIQEWMLDFLTLCKVHDVAIRILEGTPLHDRNQSRHFVTLNKNSGISADLRYVDKLCILHEERWDIDILYIPDEWHHDPNHVWLDVVRVMKQNGLEKVDFAVMHGIFQHQLPPQCPVVPHDIRKYMGIVRCYIFIGHIHQASKRDRVLASGSFDRGCHGDEGDKGYWLVEVNLINPELSKITFRVNRDALPYRTVNCEGLDYDSARAKLNDVIDQLPDGSHVRIRAGRHDPVAALSEWGKNIHRFIHWTSQFRDTEESKQSDGPIIEKVVTESITPSNVLDLIAARLKMQGCDEDVAEHALRLAEQLVEERAK